MITGSIGHLELEGVWMPTIQHSPKNIRVPSKHRFRGAVNTSKENVSPWNGDLMIEYSIRDWRNMVLFLIGKVYDLE